MTNDDAKTVLTFVEDRLDRADLTPGLIRMSSALGRFLEGNELTKLADAAIKAILRQDSNNTRNANLFMRQVFALVPSEKEQVLEERAKYWVKLGTDRGYPQQTMKKLSAISDEWLSIPF